MMSGKAPPARLSLRDVQSRTSFFRHWSPGKTSVPGLGTLTQIELEGINMACLRSALILAITAAICCSQHSFAQDPPTGLDQQFELKVQSPRQLFAEAQGQGLGVPNPKYCQQPWPNCVPTHCLPCFCLQSAVGTGTLLGVDLDTGGFSFAGLIRGRGEFTVRKKCHSTKMRFAGEDSSYWYYVAYGTPYCFAISKQAFTQYKIHFMFLYDCTSGTGFKFYQLMLKYDCPCPLPSPSPWPCYKPRVHHSYYPCHSYCQPCYSSCYRSCGY